jgi:hypothetical protein
LCDFGYGTDVLFHDGYDTSLRERSKIGEPFIEFAREIERVAQSRTKASSSDHTRGPTVKTQERAKLFRRLKDQHPGWSQAKVALEANRELGGDNFTADTVRYVYDQMGWDWERADRVR